MHTQTGSLNSSSLDGSTFENAPKNLCGVCWSRHDVHFWSHFKGADWSRHARLQWCFYNWSTVRRLSLRKCLMSVHYLWWHVFQPWACFWAGKLLTRPNIVGDAGRTVTCSKGGGHKFCLQQNNAPGGGCVGAEQGTVMEPDRGDCVWVGLERSDESNIL